MLIRIISGLVAVSVLLPTAWVGGWWFGGLGAVVAAVCLHEYFGMTHPGDGASRGAGVFLGVLILLLIVTGGARGEGGLLLLSTVFILPTLWFLIRPGPMEHAAARVGLAVLGLLWIGALGGISTSVVLLEEGFAWLLLLAGIAFGSDVGGYFVGRYLGRHKLYEKISPKKTWEGSLGAVVVGTAVAFTLWALVGPTIDPVHLALIAPAGSVLGQLGDLAESMLKRSVGVKDSGSIMPGHGGLFDRIDALLFVGPLLFLYARMVLGVRVTWLGL